MYNLQRVNVTKANFPVTAYPSAPLNNKLCEICFNNVRRNDGMEDGK